MSITLPTALKKIAILLNMDKSNFTKFKILEFVANSQA